MDKQVIKSEVETWLKDYGEERHLLLPCKFNWETSGCAVELRLTSTYLLERFFTLEKAYIRIVVADDKCNIGLVMSDVHLSAIQRQAVERLNVKTKDVSESSGKECVIYEMPGLDQDSFADGCQVGEYLDNELEDINSTVCRELSPRHEDYLRYIGPCHSQDDYGFQYQSETGKLYYGEDKCFVYIVVKDNNRTHAVQLRIKNRDDNYGTESLYPQKMPLILAELKKRIPLVTVNADPILGAPDAQSNAIRNISINFSSEAGKEEAMTRLAEAWLVAAEQLPALEKRSFDDL